MKNPIVIAIIVLVVGGAGGFFAGMKYQQSKTPTFAGRSGSGFGAGRSGGSRNGLTPVNGQIINSGTNSVTVQLQDGSSKIVLITSSTQINKAAQGTATDLVNGVRVAVFGSTNTDGSVTAQSIQVNPVQRPTPAPGTP
jgi:hypothetical protein